MGSWGAPNHPPGQGGEGRDAEQLKSSCARAQGLCAGSAAPDLGSFMAAGTGSTAWEQPPAAGF